MIPLRRKKLSKLPVAVDPSCVLYMPFEDNCGDPIEDQSQYHNDGTCHGAVPCNGPGNLALKFDGINDRVAVADSASLRVSAVTIAAWVKVDAAIGYVLAKCEDWAVGGKMSYILYIAGTRQIQLIISDDGDPPASFETTVGALSLGTWHHVVATFEETDGIGAGTYHIYVDGVLVASDGGGAEASIHIGIGRVTIGARWDSSIGGTASEFQGLLDDVMVFNRVWSAQEVYDVASVHAGDNTSE